jgi:hypothetical protein
MKPKVLIEVDNGVATYQAQGEVDVCIVDYDVLDIGGECEVPEDFLEAFEGLREAVNEGKTKWGASE